MIIFLPNTWVWDSRSSLTHATLLQLLVDWFFSLAVTLVLKKSIGRISAILSPNWLKFWPKDRLVSLLGCYSLEKSGYLLKNRVLVVFLVLEETGVNHSSKSSIHFSAIKECVKLGDSLCMIVTSFHGEGGIADKIASFWWGCTPRIISVFWG